MHWNAILAQTPAPSQAAAPATSAATATTGTAPAAGASPAQTTQPPPFFANPIILLVLMAVMMYFILFRPQSQQRKQMAKLLSALKSGDKIVTSSGIVGTVITVKDKTVSIRSADAKMEVTKSSVTEILESSDATSSTQSQ